MEFSENYCRLCLDEIKEENAAYAIDSENLCYKILQCVSIRITAEDIYSKYVCKPCMEKVNSWESFKKKCQKCQETLITHYELNEDRNIIGLNNIISEEQDEISKVKQKSGNSDVEDEERDMRDNQEESCNIQELSCRKQFIFFDNKKDLKQQKNHNMVQCQTCGVVMLKASWRLHQNLHNDKFKCQICSKQCLSQTHLHEHIAGVHEKSENHICHVCAKKFSTSTSLQIHLLIHSGQRKHRCSLCDYAARTSSNLQAHMARHAQDSISCNKCDKSFKSSKNLRDHVRRIHKLEKVHECRCCGKKFTQKYVLETHLRVHTGVRPYKCSHCSKSFSRKDGLNLHEKHHKETNS